MWLVVNSGGWHISRGWHISGVTLSMGGVDFGPYLVHGWWGSDIHRGQAKPKVSWLAKPLELQYILLCAYFQRQRSKKLSNMCTLFLFEELTQNLQRQLANESG